MLAFGLPFFGLGCFATLKVILAVIDIALGRSIEGSFWLGVAIAAMLTLIGGAAIFGFVQPKRVLVFDGDTGTLTYTRIFPFNRQRVERFDLKTVPDPETVWVKDSDQWNDGYWALKVSLRSSRSVIFPQYAKKPSQEKAKAEALRDEILDLIGAV